MVLVLGAAGGVGVAAVQVRPCCPMFAYPVSLPLFLLFSQPRNVTRFTVALALVLPKALSMASIVAVWQSGIAASPASCANISRIYKFMLGEREMGVSLAFLLRRLPIVDCQFLTEHGAHRLKGVQGPSLELMLPCIA